MGLYPPLESGETHRLQHVAKVRFRLEEERDFRATMYKKYRRGSNVVDGIDTALSVTSAGLAASGLDSCQQSLRRLSLLALKPGRLCVDCWGPAGNW